MVAFWASFLTGNIWNIYETINRIKERNEAQAEYYKIKNEDAFLDDFEGEDVPEDFEYLSN